MMHLIGQLLLRSEYFLDGWQQVLLQVHNMNESLTKERLDHLLLLNPEAGIFTWKIPIARHRAGDVAGCKHANGYVRIRIDGILYLAHRLVWLHLHGKFPAHQIDHINGARHDNRPINLREADQFQNNQNIRTPTSKNKSGFLGVSWDKRSKKWRAQIQSYGKDLSLGRFETAEEASAAYMKAKREIHPFGTI